MARSLLGGGSSALAQHLDRLLDVWPGSLSTDIAGDNRGDWLFIGEGGTVAIVDMNGITAASDPLVHNPFDDPGKVKRARCGPQGVRPIALLLDPDADLKVDTGSPAVPQDGNFSNDREDVLYIAGGVMGLWAMRAETTIGSTAQNVCVRIDDSPDNVVTNQTSRRHCNQLEVAEVDGRPYLLATFGERDGQSVLRFYDLDLVRDRLDWTTPPPQLDLLTGTGFELAATWSVTLGERANHPPGQNPQVPARSEAFPLGLAVDPEVEGKELEPPSGPWVYVAMGGHGVLRVHPTRDPATGLVTGWLTTFGPAFGDGTPYAPNPASGYVLYGNLDYRNTSRAVEFDNLDRSEPPVFADVAVQNDEDGHFLYCAVDHLNWVRFDLDLPWSSAMPIDHHEGEPHLIESEADWHGENGVAAVTSYGLWKELVRATDLPPLDGTPEGANRMDARFARRIELVRPPAGWTRANTLVVVTASGFPFHGGESLLVPSGKYSHNFQQIAGVGLSTMHHLNGPSAIATLIVYDSGSLSSNRNELGYLTSGGRSLFVPRDQSLNGVDKLRIAHSWRVDVPNLDADIAFPSPDDVNETALTFYDVANPPTGFGIPPFVRTSDAHDNRGRYGNGIGYCIADPRILTSSHNDGPPHLDGILWARPVAATSGQPETVLIGPAAPPLPGNDTRMDAGLVCPQNNQWVSDDNQPANADYQYHFMVGQGTAPNAAGDSGAGWAIMRHTVETNPLTFAPEVTWDWLRVFDQTADRWRRAPRSGYITATTTDDAFRTFAVGRATGNQPTSYAFFARPATGEGVLVASRDALLAQVAGTPVGTKQRGLFPNSLRFELNTHPEWDLIPDADPTALDDPSFWWWSGNLTPIEHQGNTVTWEPLMIRYPASLSQATTPTEEWILAVPCFTLSNPHKQSPIDFAGVVNVAATPQSPGFTVDLDAEFAAWHTPGSPGYDSEVTHLLDHYNHGLVQFWRFTNLPRDNEGELGSPSGRRRGSSNLPFIVLPDEHTCAWRIRSVTIEAGAQPAQVLLFVADFGGHLYVYDISDLPDQPRSPQGWSNASNLLATWDAPLGVYETFPSNVRALAVDHDPANPDAITVYAGVPGHGIEILTLVRTSGTTNWAFAPTSTTLETPGEPRDIEVRNEPGLKKLLLVSDGASGWRIYGE